MTEDTVPGMAEAVAARMDELAISPGEFAQEAELSRTALAKVRAGERRRYTVKTIRGVAGALDWPGDWYQRLVDP